jgi:hypothetical protein
MKCGSWIGEEFSGEILQLLESKVLFAECTNERGGGIDADSLPALGAAGEVRGHLHQFI